MTISKLQLSFQGTKGLFCSQTLGNWLAFGVALWKEKEQEGGTAVPAPALEEQGNTSLSCGTLFGY